MDLRVEKVPGFSMVECIPRIRSPHRHFLSGDRGRDSRVPFSPSLRHSVPFIMGGRSHTAHLHKLG